MEEAQMLRLLLACLIRIVSAQRYR